MPTEQKLTVRDLIKFLADCNMDSEILLEADGEDCFCIFKNPNRVSEPIQEQKVAEELKEEAKPAKKRKGRQRKVKTLEDKLEDRRKKFEYYNKTYGATAGKYEKRKWSPQEDAIVLAHPEKTDMMLTTILNRSLAAIHTRRYNLTHNRAGRIYN